MIDNSAMKRHLRREMKARLAAMSPEVISTKSYAACEKLIALPEYHRARSVMLYLPISQEVDTAGIALHAWQHGKTVLAPKVSWQQRHMLAVAIHSLDDGLVHGKYGIREPLDGEPWPVEEIDFIVIPALAYDRLGGRLGRGGGFYDRFLADPNIRALSCGLGFDEQVVDELPVHAHDLPVTVLVTDKRVLRFDPADQARSGGGRSAT